MFTPTKLNKKLNRHAAKVQNSTFLSIPQITAIINTIWVDFGMHADSHDTDLSCHEPPISSFVALPVCVIAVRQRYRQTDLTDVTFV